MNTQNRTTPIRALSYDELLARHQAGVKNPGLVEDNDPIETLFEAAENGTDHELPPVEERSWKTSRVEIEYQHPLFGTVTVGVKNCSLDEPQVKGPNTWARIYCPSSKPQELEILTTVKPNKGENDGIKVLCVAADYDKQDDSTQNTIEVKEGNVSPFVVAVQWNGNVPHTREYHRDNFDLILMNPENGMFIQIEVEIITRNGFFWLCIQEVFCGQWVRTTLATAMGLRVSVIDYGRYPLLAVPLYARYAYPGVDYVNGVCEDIPTKVAPFVKEWKAFVPYHKSVKATWNPVPTELPETMKGKGWQLAVPEFFCGVTGYGKIVCADGEKCFVHFSKIIGKDGAPVGSRGQLPLLEPMEYLALKWQMGEKGRQATAVRTL